MAVILFSGCSGPSSLLIQRTAEGLAMPEMCESIPRWHRSHMAWTFFESQYDVCKRSIPEPDSLENIIRSNEYIGQSKISPVVGGKLIEPEWKSQLELRVRELSVVDSPESAVFWATYEVSRKILVSMAKSGELDNFWNQADGVIFEPSLKSYYEPKKFVKPIAVETPKYENSSHDIVYNYVKSFPKGDCQTLWFEFRRARCWTRQAIVEATKMEQRNSFCSKIEPGSSQQKCFEYAAEIGDLDIRKNLTERGRTDIH